MSTIDNIVRNRPHETQLHIAFYQPTTVFAAQVNKANIHKGETQIPFNNVTAGVWSSLTTDMTMYVGTTPGGTNRGRLRVRGATSAYVKVSLNEHIEWQDDLYITVKRFFEPWSMLFKTVNDNMYIYMDTDVSCSDHNRKMDPVVCMGPHRAIFTGESIDWHSSGSYSPTGATFSSYIWNCEGADTALHIVAHPGPQVYNTPGHYTAQCIIYDSEGKEYSGYRHVIVLDRNSTIKKWGLESLSGSRDSFGYSARVWLREPVTLVDGALAIIFAEDWYGGVKQSVPDTTLFVGYIQDGSIRWNALEERTELTLESVLPITEGREVYGMVYNDIEEYSQWMVMTGITTRKAVVQYLRWCTTVLRTADFHMDEDNIKTHYATFVRGGINQSIQTVLNKWHNAAAVCSRDGRIWVERDANVMATGSRTFPTTMWMTAHDWAEEPSLRNVKEAPTSFLQLGGVSWDPAFDADTNPNAGAFLSGAPGEHSAPIGLPTNQTGQCISDQDDLNVRCGNIFADMNNPYPEITYPMAGNYRVHDIAPQEYTYATIDGVERRLIPQRITYKYSSQTRSLAPTIVFKAETWGWPGETIIIPTDMPTPIPPEPTPPPVPSGESFDECWAAILDRIGYTMNFMAVAPNWINVTGAIVCDPTTNPIQDFNIDPWVSTSQYAVCITKDTIWRTTNLRSGRPPTWTAVKTLTQLGFGAAGDQFCRALYTIATDGRIYVSLFDLSAGRAYVVRSSDHGATWTLAGYVAAAQVYQAQAMHIGQHHGNYVYLSIERVARGGGGYWCIQRSTDSGDTFSNWGWYTARDAYDRSPIQLTAPYYDVQDDNVIDAIVINGGFWKGNAVIEFDTTGAGTWLSYPALTTESSNTCRALNVSTWYKDQMAYITGESQGAAIVRTLDHGANWTNVWAGSSWTGYYLQAVGLWPYDPQRIWMMGSLTGGLSNPNFFYTADGGANWAEKHGDWTEAVGGVSSWGVKGVTIIPKWMA